MHVVRLEMPQCQAPAAPFELPPLGVGLPAGAWRHSPGEACQLDPTGSLMWLLRDYDVFRNALEILDIFKRYYDVFLEIIEKF